MISLSVSVTEHDALNGPCTVVRLSGEADVTTELLPSVLAEETAKKPRLLIVELSGLTFIDSGALHVIIQAYLKLRQEGLTLALASPSPPVTRILSLVGADQVIRVYSTLEDALAER